MATFRTDPETGRTVISQDNIVSSGSTNPGRPGGESGERGDPVLSQQEFMNVTGRTATNPYGKQGFFSRVFGIDPSKISYTNNIPGGNQGIAQLNSLAYDRYMNPAARVNVFGDEVGGDPTTGQLRYGVQPGDLTRFGTAVPARREGIAGILDNLPFGIGMASRMFGSTPARVPGFDVREVVPQLGLGGPQPGEGVDPAQRMSSEMLSLGYDPDTRIPGGGGELDVGPFASDFYYDYARPEDVLPVIASERLLSGYDPDTRIPGGGGELDVGPFASDFYYNFASPEQIARARRTETSIPSDREMSQERISRNQVRINELLAEIEAATAGFPDPIRPAQSSIPTAEELMQARPIEFAPAILPGSVVPGDEMNVNAPGLF